MRWTIAAAAAAAALSAGPAAAEEPITLVCTGSRIQVNSTMNDDLEWKHDRTATNFSFELAVSPSARTVSMNGRPMYVLRFDDEAIAFSPDKPGLKTSFLKGGTPTHTVSRRTGVISIPDGSGTCAKVQTAAPLF